MAVPPCGEGVLRQMRVSVRDPRIAADVVAYIGAMGFSACSVDEDMIAVSPREDVSDQQARRELDLYLALWRVVEERDDVALLP
jgi:hypothetical protein